MMSLFQSDNIRICQSFKPSWGWDFLKIIPLPSQCALSQLTGLVNVRMQKVP